MNETYQKIYALQSRSGIKDATLAVGAAIALTTSGCGFVMNVAEDPTYLDRVFALAKYSRELKEGIDDYHTPEQLAEMEVELFDNMRLVREIREWHTGVKGKVGPQIEYEAKYGKRMYVSDNQKTPKNIESKLQPHRVQHRGRKR
jgi:hypothetical protein